MIVPLYAITGASGQLGHLAVEDLLDRGVVPAEVVALARSRDKVVGLSARGVEVREADYSRPETLESALAGVERVLLVSSSDAGNRFAHHANVIEAAAEAGVSRIVYTSMLKADTTGNPLAGDHRETEELLRESAVAATILRNGWYTENYTEQMSGYLESGDIVGAAGEGKISGASRPDYAAAAVAALVRDQVGDLTYELGGEDFDLADLASTITAVSGTEVTYRDLPAPEYAAALRKGGLDQETAEFVAALDQSIARGELQTDSEDLVELLGRPATPLRVVIAKALGR